MGTMPSWYTNMYKNAVFAGDGQQYLNGKKPQQSAGALAALQGIVGNSTGQIKPPGSPVTVRQPVTNAAAPVNTGVPAVNNNLTTAQQPYVPGVYKSTAVAPTMEYTPAQRATYEEMIKRATGILDGQWKSEDAGYDNQLAAIKTSLQNIISGYNTQYTNDSADLEKNLQKDLKTNIESAASRGMTWSTIPDIMAGDLEKNNQDNLKQLKASINNNIAQATNTAQTNENGVLNMKAALAGKYGSMAQEQAWKMLDSDNATKDNADNRALELLRLKSSDYNAAEDRNTNLFTNNEKIKADIYTSGLDRTSRESIASADRTSSESIADKNRLSNAEIAEKDRLQRKYDTDVNALTVKEGQRLDALNAKANRVSNEKINAANNKASALDTDKRIKADRANTILTTTTQKQISAADNATSRAIANINALHSGSGSSSNDKGLTAQQKIDQETYGAARISGFMKGIDLKALGLKKPTTNSDWEQWKGAYESTLTGITNGSIEPSLQKSVMSAFKTSDLYKQYQTYAKQFAPKSTTASKSSKSSGDPVQALKASIYNTSAGVVGGAVNALKNAIATGKKNNAAAKPKSSSLINSGNLFSGVTAPKPVAKKATTTKKKTAKK